MTTYSREQLYDAMRRADAAGDAAAVKAIIAQLEAPDTATPDEKGLTGDPVSYEPPATLGDGIQNAVAGGVQGAVGGLWDFPQEVAKAPTYAMNALTRGVAGGLDVVGLEGPASALRRGVDRYEQDLERMPTASGLVERLSPTPAGMENARTAAQLIGGVAVPFGPKVAPRIQAPKPNVLAKTAEAQEAAQVVNAGQRERVRVMTSDVKKPRSFIAKNVQATGEKIPFAGTGGPRVKQNEERIAAVKRLASDFGVEGSEQVIDSVADDLAKTRGGKLTALTNRKKAVIERIQQPFTAAPNTVRAINEQVRKLQGIDADEYAPVIERLQRFGESLTSGKTLDQIEGQRRLLGEMFADPKLAGIKTDGQRATNAIYGPLRDDMGAFIKANGGDDAFKAWKSSNDELAAMAGELKTSSFKSALNDAETTPENVKKLLFSQKPSDVRRLFGSLSPAGKEKAKAAVLHEAIEKAGGLDKVSPQTFANSLEKFGKTTGIIFGDDAPRIEGIVRLLQKTQRASEAAAAPPTGVQNTAIIGSAVLTDWLGGLGAATTAAGLAGGAARLYESAPVRNLLVGLSRTKPGSPQERTMVARIEKVLASQEGIGPAMNDNVRTVTSAAASDGTEAQPNQ